jgi:C_GCAxxG_C_C family probable redox protein
MGKIEDAVQYFGSGYNCSQSVLAAFGPDLGLDRASCLKVASTFGGGLGRRAEACGAVTGALMALGLKYGGKTVDDPAAKTEVYKYAGEFMDRFKALHGSLICRELLGFDISTDEGLRQMKEQNAHELKCKNLVASAAQILEEMLQDG